MMKVKMKVKVKQVIEVIEFIAMGKKNILCMEIFY